jgi:hypothetical protein
MNTRIRELMEQAMELVDPYAVEGEFGPRQLNEEKFAELIVKECAQFVEDKFDFIGDEIIVKEKMLEHFGVK